MNPHSKALDSMFSDMDDMEQKKMFGEPDGDEGKGVSITISVSPQGEISEMNKGGVACMSDGGQVPHKGGTRPMPELESDISDQHGLPDPEYEKGEMGMAKGGIANPTDDKEDLALPPFLRKKKKSFSNS